MAVVAPESLLRNSERIPLAPSAPGVPKIAGVPSCMHGFLQERAQRSEIDDILCHVPALGRLDDFGNVAETRLAHDIPECVQPDFSFADVFMTVHAEPAAAFESFM